MEAEENKAGHHESIEVNEELLRRILSRLEPPEHHRRMEVFNAVLLALATTASAWCAYQSNLWSGVQTFRLSDASDYGHEAGRLNLVGIQSRALDVQLLIPYMEAKHRRDDSMAEFYHARFRPSAAKAIEVWLKTDPFNNPNAPKRPFELPEYVQPEAEEAKKLTEKERVAHADAQFANEASDKYVLQTVLFASVLFFGGIGGTFESTRLKKGALGIALTLFLVTVAFMATMPICKG